MANAYTTPKTYQFVGIIDELPPAGRGKFVNEQLALIKQMARANPGKHIEFVSDAKNITALGGSGYKFHQRGGRTFCTYQPNTNGTH